ncbi:condensation domain-containing protein [Propionimicrobium sp. PCR01-08-3]|uniref:condensation domain-containing protein n=1 Tax=Propionimicrobium sp. PCR01-08-3 TaxID=3052086 RepID=UPI00255CC987|nr:condensation domain-containing protein [Propionimicrobium sp. PCR01-08-3]WIY83853.1 condensation domain-containing protein [Propionimicrobium sp. PCR01-08-3]
MRLTNIAQLNLPFGRLMGYDVAVLSREGSLPVSFDQGRHVGAGLRPGSWMALSFQVPERLSLGDLEQAWLAVIDRHLTLRSVFEPGPDGPRLHQVRLGPGRWVEHPISTGQPVNAAVRDVLDLACAPYAQPSHRLCVLETAVSTTVLIAADHAHVDMWSMLVLARDLLRALGQLGTGHTPELAVAPGFAEHTQALLSRQTAPEQVRERWTEILGASGEVMPRFPLPLGEPEPFPERVEVRDVLGTAEDAAFEAFAKDQEISTLSLAVSVMTKVTLEVAGQPLRAVFPVHSRYEETWHDSVGWFITNSVIESADPEPRLAQAAVREAIRLGSWPLDDILQPWGGMPEAPGMFAISWLDLRRLPVQIDTTSLQAQYVSAVIRTDGVMLWFVFDQQGLHLRCRYPDTRKARRNVGGWLDRTVAQMREVANTYPHAAAAEMDDGLGHAASQDRNR